MLPRAVLTLLVVAVVVVLAGSAIDPGDADARATAAEAQDATYNWVGVGTAETPRRQRRRMGGRRPPSGRIARRDHDRDRLELRELDEELGPGGSAAHDEVRGPLRRLAARAALDRTGPGRVLSVERDTSREREVMEVNLRRGDGWSSRWGSTPSWRRPR